VDWCAVCKTANKGSIPFTPSKEITMLDLIFVMLVYLSALFIVIMCSIWAIGKMIKSYCEDKYYREGWNWTGLKFDRGELENEKTRLT